MVRIRLKRTGTRNAVCFRVVVMDQRSSRDGKAIEEVGFYNPRSKEEKINLERINYWVGVGAEMSETVKDIVERAKGGVVLKDRVRPAAMSKKAKAKAAAEAEAKAAAEAEAKAAAEAAAAEAEAPAEA
ncbi:MAG: 30S ribosomal protein S16 [Lentisphaerae bacterium]|nr:30S ribosomal protein S16 [Lentisphaerota bacterium]